MKWETKPLNQLGYVSRGKSRHRPRNAEFLYGGEYPFIQTADVKDADLYIKQYSQTYSDEGLAQSKLWKKGTMCITIAANIADTAILDIDACFPDSIIGYVADEKVANVKFIKYFFDTIQESMKQASQGATQDNLSVEKLLTFNIAAPSLKIQNKIASILSAYDDLLENNFKRIKLLEEAAFIKYKSFKADNNLHENSIDELCYVVMGQSPESEFYNENHEGMPFHQGVTNFNFRFVQHKIYTSKTTRVAEPNDILFSVRAPVGRLNIALDKLCIGRGLGAIRSKKNYQSYLFYQLKDYFFQEDMLGSGSIFNSVTKNELLNVKLKTLSENIIQEFEKFSVPIDNQIKCLTIQNYKLKEARDILLPRLMNGEIEI